MAIPISLVFIFADLGLTLFQSSTQWVHQFPYISTSDVTEKSWGLFLFLGAGVEQLLKRPCTYGLEQGYHNLFHVSPPSSLLKKCIIFCDITNIIFFPWQTKWQTVQLHLQFGEKAVWFCFLLLLLFQPDIEYMLPQFGE